MPKRKFDDIASSSAFIDNNDDQCTAASYINLTTSNDNRVSCFDGIGDDDQELGASGQEMEGARRRRRVTYGDVTVFYFQRAQGFTCVPTSGGLTLGMLPKHYASRSLTLSEHQDEIRRYRQSRLYEQQSNFLHQQHLNSIFSNSNCNSSSTTGYLKIDANNNDSQMKSFEEQNSNIWSNLESEQDEDEDEDEENFEEEEGNLDEEQAQCSEEFTSMPDEYYLQPLDAKQRRTLLKSTGVHLDKTEKLDCQRIRRSRLQCGCTCENGQCSPDTCACALDKIKCQVDRAQFPCACLSNSDCANQSGRVEFDTVRVRSHFLNTMMRLRLSQRFASSTLEQQPPSPIHTRFEHSEYDRKNSYLINTDDETSRDGSKKFKFQENREENRQNFYSITTLYTNGQKMAENSTSYYYCSRSNGYTHFSTGAAMEEGKIMTKGEDFCAENDNNAAGSTELGSVLKKSMCESVLA